MSFAFWEVFLEREFRHPGRRQIINTIFINGNLCWCWWLVNVVYSVNQEWFLGCRYNGVWMEMRVYVNYDEWGLWDFFSIRYKLNVKKRVSGSLKSTSRRRLWNVKGVSVNGLEEGRNWLGSNRPTLELWTLNAAKFRLWNNVDKCACQARSLTSVAWQSTKSMEL